jgi:hypothetical protein
MTREQDLQALQSAFETFTACLSSLPVLVFLRPMTQWAPRDVVAHLIGWNRYTRTGYHSPWPSPRSGEGQGEAQGMVPFYFADAADDFRHVNAHSVQTYASPEKSTLLEELTNSFQELLHFLASLPPEAWEADYRVPHKGGPVTIAHTVGALSSDYLEHTKEIERWVASGNE